MTACESCWPRARRGDGRDGQQQGRGGAMHGARGAVYAGEEVRRGREVRPQGPEAVPDEEGRG